MKTFIRGSSPHTRGAPHGPIGVEAHEGIIPAYAGSTSRSSAICFCCTDHPRIRGEHQSPSYPISPRTGSSPHTRGARSCSQANHTRRGIIPAYAGSTILEFRTRRICSDHPRIRGEHEEHPTVSPSTEGSSPHTRGAHFATAAFHVSLRIIPAYAGSTSALAAQVGVDLRIIPAYAGSTRWRFRRISMSTDHPRIRGEHGVGLSNRRRSEGSSPHTRGAPGFGAVVDPERGIIPAYAGSTPVDKPVHITPPDHPRIRGEHVKLSYL